MKKGIEITLDLGAQEFGPRPTLTVEEKRERMRNMVKSLAEYMATYDQQKCYTARRAACRRRAWLSTKRPALSFLVKLLCVNLRRY